jgi:hypothetical protein
MFVLYQRNSNRTTKPRMNLRNHITPERILEHEGDAVSSEGTERDRPEPSNHKPVQPEPTHEQITRRTFPFCSLRGDAVYPVS